jgi:hypothetical protein
MLLEMPAITICSTLNPPVSYIVNRDLFGKHSDVQRRISYEGTGSSMLLSKDASTIGSKFPTLNYGCMLPMAKRRPQSQLV